MHNKKCKYLCVLFVASTGLNDESLGCDESEIASVSCALIDTDKSVTLDRRQFLILAESSQKSNLTASENSTKLSKCFIENAPLLEQAIYDIEQLLMRNGVHPVQLEDNEEVLILTDGPLHLRQALLPECKKKQVHLSPLFHRYFDLRKEFKKYFSSIPRISCLNDILSYVYIDRCGGGSDCDDAASTSQLAYAANQCEIIEKLVLKMLKDGHIFTDPEVIFQDLSPGIWFDLYFQLPEGLFLTMRMYSYIDDQIEENTVVKVRGIPWQCTDQDIYNFFAGLNISEGGIALCLSSQGRRNGEALVRFEDEDQRELALRRHKHHIGTRYIEVYRASSKEFLSIAGGSNAEAKEFLSRSGKVIVRMRGLPFNATAKDVIEFFTRGDNPCDIVDGEEGVLFVHYPDGRSTGDAFVMFKSDEETNQALLRHRESMGPRYIELFRSTSAEVQQVLKRSQDPKYFPNSVKDQHHYHQYAMMNPNLTSSAASSPTMSNPTGVSATATTPLQLLPPEMISGGNRRDCVRLRNLPLDCAVEQILEFLGIHSQHIIQHGVHMVLNTQGQPSGEAFIQFDSEPAAFNVFTHKNGKCMHFAGKKFHIEVIQCSGEEMNLVLMGVLPSNLVNMQNVYKPSQMGKTISASVLQYPSDPIQLAHMTGSSLAAPNGQQIYPGLIYPTATGTPTAPGMRNLNLALIPTHTAGAGAGSSSSPLNTPIQVGPNSTSANGVSLTATGTPTTAMPPPMGPVHLATPNGLIPGQQSPYHHHPHHPAQIIWYYPTPPVSPSTAPLFLPHPQILSYSVPSVLVVKGASPSVTINEILSFLHGYEIYPDCIQFQSPTESYAANVSSSSSSSVSSTDSNGPASSTVNTIDVYITLFNRAEAERAVLEKNHQKLGSNTVELYLAF